MTDSARWHSAITSIQPNEIRLRGYRIDQLMGGASFADTVYLALRGELPSPGVSKVVNAVLVSSVDHGVTPPSALAARNAASTGAPLNACVASGVLAINRYHGGAVEGAMEFFMREVDRAMASSVNLSDAASQCVARCRSEKVRVPGFGHRIHTDDPRSAKLFEVASETGNFGEHCEFSRHFRASLARELGRDLPINVDGAIAAVLCDLGFTPDVANAFFVISRVVGLVAHSSEERKRERPMRTIDQSRCTYDGPAPCDITNGE
ncbi:MAG: citryl-CoA lyase [Planctomycetota bacterium]|nr:citryl-CoA lyase [Planctomycetota bacterium]